MMNQLIQRVAHRGGAQLAPENTLAAFRNALTLHVNAIELDVHISRDGHLVVFHDDVVDKRTNGSGRLYDLDFAYLRSLDAAARFPNGWSVPQQIPTLREVLELAKGNTHVYIEVKQMKRNRTLTRYPNIAEMVFEEVRSTGMLDQVLVISFDWTLLATFKSLEPTLQTGVIVSEKVWNPRSRNALQHLIEQATQLKCDWINIDYKLFTPELLHLAHNHGFKLGLWTVNTETALLRFAAAGLDSLTSDRPDLFSVLPV